MNDPGTPRPKYEVRGAIGSALFGVVGLYWAWGAYDGGNRGLGVVFFLMAVFLLISGVVRVVTARRGPDAGSSGD